jgi:hypothetical protein
MAEGGATATALLRRGPALAGSSQPVDSGSVDRLQAPNGAAAKIDHSLAFAVSHAARLPRVALEPVSNSTLPGRPPQPSWRIRRRKTRSGMARRRSDMLASLSMLSLPQRSQMTRRNHDGNDPIGSSSALSGVGSGSVPELRQWRGVSVVAPSLIVASMRQSASTAGAS